MLIYRVYFSFLLKQLRINHSQCTMPRKKSLLQDSFKDDSIFKGEELDIELTNRATSWCPCAEAKCRGVSSPLLTALTRPPLCRRSSTILY